MNCSTWKQKKALPVISKTDILQKKIWYIYADQPAAGSFVLDLEDVKKIINKKGRGEKPSVEKLGTPVVVNKETTMQVGSVSDDIIREK